MRNIRSPSRSAMRSTRAVALPMPPFAANRCHRARSALSIAVESEMSLSAQPQPPIKRGVGPTLSEFIFASAMDLADILEDVGPYLISCALLTSFQLSVRSPKAAQLTALQHIQTILADVCVRPHEPSQRARFLALQNDFETNSRWTLSSCNFFLTLFQLYHASSTAASFLLWLSPVLWKKSDLDQARRPP